MIRIMRYGSPFAILLFAACGVGGGAGASAAPAPPKPAARAQAGDLQTTWTQLRAAILAHDLRRVAELTAFPLRVHGVTDDEVSHIGREAFPAAFDKMLKQSADGGPATNLDSIRATPVLSDAGKTFARPVGGLELKRTPAGPRMVMIYVEDE